VTVNDYLARRDSEWVGQVHKFLGLDVGLVQASMEATDRHKAYHADVTYVTNSELGFGEYPPPPCASSPPLLTSVVLWSSILMPGF